MKATLEYTLPEEREEHRLATVSGEMAAEIIAADELLRNWQKYGNDCRTPDEAIERVRALLSPAVALARGE